MNIRLRQDADLAALVDPVFNTLEGLQAFTSLFLNEAVVGIALVAVDGRFIYVNPAACRFWRRSETELLRMTWMEITAGEFTSDDLSEVQAVAQGTKDEYEMPKDYIAPDGAGHLPGYLTVRRILCARGEFLCFLSQIEDVYRHTPIPANVTQIADRAVTEDTAKALAALTWFWKWRKFTVPTFVLAVVMVAFFKEWAWETALDALGVGG